MTADEKFARYVSEEEEKAYGIDELLSEDKFEDVEGMRFGTGLVLGCVCLFVAAGVTLGLSVGFGLYILSDKIL